MQPHTQDPRFTHEAMSILEANVVGRASPRAANGHPRRRCSPTGSRGRSPYPVALLRNGDPAVRTRRLVTDRRFLRSRVRNDRVEIAEVFAHCVDCCSRVRFGRRYSFGFCNTSSGLNSNVSLVSLEPFESIFRQTSSITKDHELSPNHTVGR